MGVMVYPLLGEVLRDRNMTVADLERDIVRRYGITVERGALDLWIEGGWHPPGETPATD